jgi:hypothetical protein
MDFPDGSTLVVSLTLIKDGLQQAPEEGAVSNLLTQIAFADGDDLDCDNDLEVLMQSEALDDDDTREALRDHELHDDETDPDGRAYNSLPGRL